ncbi:hypothetical protein [Pseudomonas putida]|uniref:Uncharacterized protein n=1 Tax=Pseudomonas putida TaxID=303 RepID=A0AAW5HKW1_PSEPU|nr:hypothetical protein [Pseudomonas putida]MCO1621719.1 hypothetical protein [Pseudomonas putida]
MPHTLKRVKLSDQLLQDPLKALALLERILLNAALTLFVFFVLTTFEITPDFLTVAAYSGILTFSIITLKTMYYDQALSQINLKNQISNTAIDNTLRNAGYTQNEKGEYLTPKKMFSLFYRCDSEKIIMTVQDSTLTLKGPYTKVASLLTMLASAENTST